jgi:hypothetical protein
MRAVVICPADRGAVAALAEKRPLALVPFLGTPVLGHTLSFLASAGAKEVTILAADRPDEVRRYVSGGEAWGVKIEVAAERAEVAAAAVRGRRSDAGSAGWLAEPHDVWVLDRLPQFPAGSLWHSYGQWHRALLDAMPQFGAARVGMRQYAPGIWVGLRAKVSAAAHLEAPCWIGARAWVGPGATVGPGTVLEDGVFVDAGARVTGSVVGPGTYVGSMTEVRESVAWGGLLVNLATGSKVTVTDAFLLGEAGKGEGRSGGRWLGRLAALGGLLLGSPLLAVAWVKSRRSGHRLWTERSGVRAGPGGGGASFRYFELAAFQGWARRWPQLANVVRGEMAWVGNRPLTPEQAATLEGDFERLWIAVLPGVISLADAEGCAEGFGDEAKAHAAFYAAQPGARQDWGILRRAFRRRLRGDGGG